ncbi:proton-conducting transporter membrane subunit [Ruminiclostridium cellobioparum]|uniref:proton-conducting transporter transmembrane domain-containing protein n=1 Tax=Ruminiclostridium cellobioparum TaxID=29355 RepID=UPI000485D852|nr:proton-conducting transporter membrane subunit [Ruminiclostridium cellobioparum]
MSANYLTTSFIICLLLYIAGSLSSLATYFKPKISNFLSNIFSLAAGSLLSISMIHKLFTADTHVISFNIDNNIPFINLNFKIDNLAAFFLLLIGIVTSIVSIYSFSYMKRFFTIKNVGVFGVFYNLFILSMVMLAASNNILLFLVFWELMSLLSYFLVIYEHERDEVQKAGKTYIIMTYTGTAFITAAFLLIVYFTGSFEFSAVTSSLIPKTYSNLIYIFLLLGFGTKAGIIPMHIWLPYAYTEAPSNVAAIMSAVMKKMSIYGLLRIVFFILHENAMWWGVLTLIIGTVSAVFGIAYSVASTTNIKRLLSYSSIENMGIIFCGIGIMLIARASGNSFLLSLSLTAVLLHTLNHALFKSLLFMGAGAVHYGTGTRNMEKLGGLIKKMPLTAVFIFIGCLAVSAVPPFNGFASEYIIFQSIINSIISFVPSGQFPMVILFVIVAAFLAITGALVVFTYVQLFGISFLGMPRSTEAQNAIEPEKPMLAALAAGALLCIVPGVGLKQIIKLIDNVSVDLIDIKLLSTDWSLSKFLHYPVENGSLSVSFSSLSIMLLVFIAVVSLLAAVFRKRTLVQKYNTWDCGYTKLNPRMQYSAIGFSKSVRIIFRGLFKPNRDLVITEGAGPYFIKKASYTLSTEKVIEKYLYKPFILALINFSRKARYKIQTGSIHAYLMYFFCVLILMLLYYSFLAS